MATVTRAGLARAVHQETGLPQSEAAALVETVIETIAERLTAGEAVGISGFGRFGVRDKGPRRGAQPEDRRAGGHPGAPGRDVPTVGGLETAYRGEDGRRRQTENSRAGCRCLGRTNVSPGHGNPRGATMTGIDESALTKGQLRKLNVRCASPWATTWGERAFAAWLESQRKAEVNSDGNAAKIVDVLWPLVEEGRLAIPRGGYLLRRGRGRIIVEAARS